MANVCIDTVVFYPAAGSDSVLLAAMARAVQQCYPVGVPYSERYISRLLDQAGINKEGLSLRGDLTGYECNQDSLVLYFDTAWTPLYDCYKALAGHFGLHFVMQSEEPGCGVFINTDAEGTFLPTRYRLYLGSESAEGTVYEKLYADQVDLEQYFTNEEELLSYLSGYGFTAGTLDELETLLDSDYVRINAYETSYE